MSELKTVTKLYLKMRPIRSDIRTIQGFAVRAGLTDLYRWCDRAMHVVIRRERERYAAYKICLHEVKQQPYTPSPDFLEKQRKHDAFFTYWQSLDHAQREKINGRTAPELTEQMQVMTMERESLPFHIIDLWHLGQQDQAKQAIYRYYRLGRDWQDLHNQRYKMVMDRMLAMQLTTD